jgi:uncharacterized Zn finger protein
MKNIQAEVRFSRNGKYENTETYEVQIPKDSENEVQDIMDAIRPLIQEEFQDDEDFEDGCIDWQLYSW